MVLLGRRQRADFKDTITGGTCRTEHQEEGAVCNGIPEGSLTKGSSLIVQGEISQDQTGCSVNGVKRLHRAGDFGILIHLSRHASTIPKYSFEMRGRSHLKTMGHIT